jgi:hypothetical protein
MKRSGLQSRRGYKVSSELERVKADILAALDEKRPLGLYAVFYDGETRPVAAFVLEQDAERYARERSGGAPWEIKHGQFVPDESQPAALPSDS